MRHTAVDLAEELGNHLDTRYDELCSGGIDAAHACRETLSHHCSRAICRRVARAASIRCWPYAKGNSHDFSSLMREA